MSCFFSGPNEKGLIEAAKKHRGYTDSEYNFKSSISIANQSEYGNVLYSHIGWVEVTHIRSGDTFRLQFGYTKDAHNWEPTPSQRQHEIEEIGNYIKQLKKLKNSN
jgi:hypothetical protein